MRRVRLLVAVAAVLLALPLAAEAANGLKVGTGLVAVKIGANVSLPVLLTTTDQVQGLVVAVDWDGALAEGVGLVAGAALADADTVVFRTEPSYAVIGVVMDNDGIGGEVINPGTDIELAILTLKGLAEGNLSVGFADGLYATVEGGPVLDNIVVVGGLSVGSTEGLTTEPGTVDVVVGFNRYYVIPGVGTARVMMENLAPVEGYVVALCQPSAELTLTAIVVGAAAVAQAADFSADDVFPTGGTLGVVIDLNAPFTNNTIPVGDANEVAVFQYTCVSPPAVGVESVPVTFCDATLGSPLKENVFVVGGLSVAPSLEDGVVLCEPVCTPVPENLVAGNCADGLDNDCDGLTDLADPDCVVTPPGDQAFACGSATLTGSGVPGVVEVSRGSTAEVNFWMKSPEDNILGAHDTDHIQGFSMALSYDCSLQAHEVLDVTGTIVEAVGAEYVTAQADNNPADGDGCELILGVLVDALPPFDGVTLPPSDEFVRVGSVLFDVSANAACGEPLSVEFTDGVNGRGKVPIRNLISVENYSKSVQFLNCAVRVVERARFFRGDCNFSLGGILAVDISDAAAVVSYLFLPGTYKFSPPCLDACDANDDGRIDLADAVTILRYLFQQGRFPPAPGPGYRETGLPNPNSVEASPAGEDPTLDMLDCKAGTGC
jgi:hypothetical protein